MCKLKAILRILTKLHYTKYFIKNFIYKSLNFQEAMIYPNHCAVKIPSRVLLKSFIIKSNKNQRMNVMRKLFMITATLMMTLGINLAYADDESVQYSQKTLPNGDTQTIMKSSDGTSVTSIQHKDGSSESTTTAADGTKSVTVVHADGSSDTHITQKK